MRILFIIFLILIISCSSSKHTVKGSFYGEIVYTYTVIPKFATANVDSILNTLSGDETQYLINDKLYKSSYFKDGEFTYSFTYDPETKRMYDYRNGRQYITYRDSQEPNTEELDISVHRDSLISILGYEAYQTIDNTYEYTSKTYYSDAIRINYAAFEGHKVGHWFERLKLTDGAISLKSITDKESHLEVLEAISVTQRELSPEEFEFSENILVVPSFSIVEEPVDLTRPTPNQMRCYESKIAAAPDVFVEEDRTFTSYVAFVVGTNGKAKFANAIEVDGYGLSDIAIDIINTCNFNFKPGKINGEAVESESFLPINFQI